MKQRTFLLSCFLSLFTYVHAVDANLQIFYDFGSMNTACANQRTDRLTTTFEFFHPDAWGSTFFFIDMDFGLTRMDNAPTEPKNCPFGTYTEFTRSFNFWQQTKAKDLSVHLEYDGGLGVIGGQVVEGGYGVNSAVLVGFDYFLHTPDYKNTFTLQLLFKPILDDANRWVKREDGQWKYYTGNQVPLQFTFVWACQDLFKAKGLTFSGFADIWGQKLTFKDPNKQSFVFISEPQLWYAFGQWFKCPNLCVGTEIEFSYNFTGNGFMCNPCLGLKWLFL